MMVDLSKLSFYSAVNYMKRDSSSDSASVSVSGTQTVTHGLGYIPFYEVFTEIDNNGIIWNNTKIDRYTGSSLTGVTRDNPDVAHWTTTSTLTIKLTNNASATGSRTVYWLIYKDYGDVS